MNKIQLNILKRHAGPFVFCFVTIMFLLLMQFLILYIDKLISKDLGLGVIVELILTNLAYMVVLAAPMAILVASLMAFGKFTELNELTALKAAGVNPIHTITPVLIAAAILSVFLAWFSNDVLPDANQRARTLFLDIRQKKPGFDLEENEFYEGIDNYTILAQNIRSDSLFDVILFQKKTSSTPHAIIKANSGRLVGANEMVTFYLYDGTITRFNSTRENHQTQKVTEEIEFQEYRISFDLSEMAFTRSDPEDYSRSDRTMNVQSMLAVVDSLKADIKRDKEKLFAKNAFAGDVEHVTEKERENTSQFLEYTKIDTLGKVESPESDFLVLTSIRAPGLRGMAYSTSLNQLRDYRSAYTTLNVNVEWRRGRIDEYWVEIFKKFSIPLACIIFVLLGAPIGMYVRKGNLGIPALIGAGFLTFYWISLIQGEKLADRQHISPFTGMWFSDILLAIVGGYLVIRVSTSFRISNLWKRD